MKKWMSAAMLMALIAVLTTKTELGGQSSTGQVRFADATAATKISFKHNSGRAGKKWLPETMGAGAAWLDMDQDGDQDLLLVNSKSWTAKPQKSLHALYRNDNGIFTNVVAGSGLDVEMFGMGVAVGDYDNDGRGDVYITAIDGDKLFHNEGNGKFRDVTKSAGIDNVKFGTSAVWFDYDRDGQLDLFVGNYVAWTAKGDIWCSLDGQTKSYCTPESYKGVAPKLYKNLGGGKFVDMAAKAGLGDSNHKTLGVAMLDFNNDGWMDLFVANDTQQNRLYRNNKNGTFTDDGLAAGVAFGEDGVARGAMGADTGDYDRSGRMHLLVGNFTNQMLALYHNEGNGLFVDESPRSNMGKATLLNLTFGAFFFDFDLDGYLDIFCANGHIEEEINRVQPKVQFRQIASVFRNKGRGKFEDATRMLGADLAKPMVARGAAYADFDKDGDLDMIVTQNGGPAVLYRNDGGNKNRWLHVRTVGSKSNRDGIGAIVEVQSAGGKQMQMVKTGSSYCSQSELGLTFGLGADQKIDQITVKWPSGQVQKLTGVPVNKRIVIEEGKSWRPA
jgi:enediyne biosynthesis protein E4